jgi:hypothetical protein
MVASEMQKPVHSCGTTAKTTGFDDASIFLRGTLFVPLKNQQPKLALSEMEKLYPSWKVYQGRMGCDSSKNRYHSAKWLSTTLQSKLLKENKEQKNCSR